MVWKQQGFKSILYELFRLSSSQKSNLFNLSISKMFQLPSFTPSFHLHKFPLSEWGEIFSSTQWYSVCDYCGKSHNNYYAPWVWAPYVIDGFESYKAKATYNGMLEIYEAYWFPPAAPDTIARIVTRPSNPPKTTGLNNRHDDLRWMNPFIRFQAFQIWLTSGNRLRIVGQLFRILFCWLLLESYTCLRC